MASDHRPLLAAQTLESLTFILGMLAAMPLRPDEAGRLSAVCTELRRRGRYEALVSGLDDDLAAKLRMLEMADRGQHFKVTGQRRLV